MSEVTAYQPKRIPQQDNSGSQPFWLFRVYDFPRQAKGAAGQNAYDKGLIAVRKLMNFLGEDRRLTDGKRVRKKRRELMGFHPGSF